jgi:hypothetical protein
VNRKIKIRLRKEIKIGIIIRIGKNLKGKIRIREENRNRKVII